MQFLNPLLMARVIHGIAFLNTHIEPVSAHWGSPSGRDHTRIKAVW